jgi:hypothetical protein
LQKVIDFLKDDVRKFGGSAGETINLHGNLLSLTVAQAPWGLIVIKKEVTLFESWAEWITTPL